MNHASGTCRDYSLHAAVHVELAKYLLPIPLHGVFRKHQPARNLAIGNITGGQLQYVNFAMGKLTCAQAPERWRLTWYLDPVLLRCEALQHFLRVLKCRPIDKVPGGDRVEQLTYLFSRIDE